MRVLLVEDDPMVGAALVGRLEDEAYAVDWVRDASDALVSTRTHRYDVVLLDLGLPDRDGTQLLRDLRRSGQVVPVIVVTARDDTGTRVSSLDGGADDYVSKPFEPAELLARMRAVLRRGSDSTEALLRAAPVTLDVARHVAVLPDGREVPLARREFAVLRALMTRPGTILSREELEHRVYGWGREVESNAVEYAIHGLRGKLGAETIRNVRGVGWTVPPEQTRS